METLLEKTAKAIYRADLAPKRVDWSHLSKAEQRRYEVMAAAALAVALREPVYPDLSLAEEPATASAAPAKN
jgi:hypothetical protein